MLGVALGSVVAPIVAIGVDRGAVLYYQAVIKQHRGATGESGASLEVNPGPHNTLAGVDGLYWHPWFDCRKGLRVPASCIRHARGRQTWLSDHGPRSMRP